MMKILICFDGSPCSEVAVAEVARRPWPPETEVRLLTVDPPPDPALSSSGDATAFDEIIQRQQTELRRRLRESAEALEKEAPALHVSTAFLAGWAKDTIVEEAERWGADLVVVGSHGYGPIRRFFLGSVSLFVAHHAPCSVEIVRSPARAPIA